MRKLVLALCFLAAPAFAEPYSVSDLKACSIVSADQERLSCFDKLAKDRIAVLAAPAAPQGPQQVKFVQAEDLYVAPERYQGQNIEVKGLWCVFIAKGDYRCVAAGVNIAVFGEAIKPDAERDVLERDCAAVSKALKSDKCRRTIRFVPSDISRDFIDGYQKRIKVSASDVELSPFQTKRR